MNNKINIKKKKLQSLYLNQRLSTAKIAKLYNCNPETVRRRLIEQGVKRRFREIKVKIPIEKLKNLYTEKKMSTLSLAKQYGCSQWTIRFKLMKNKINLRSSSDFLKWRSPGNQIIPNINSSTHLSYVLGVLLGDGWIYNHKHSYFICLDTIDYSFSKSFYNSLKNINLNPNIFQSKGRFWRTIASSKLFYLWFKNLKSKEIRKAALDYPLDFLRGIYESEGCLTHRHYKKLDKKYLSLVIVSCEEETISLTKLLIENLGLNPRLNLRKPKPPRKPIFVLTLDKQNEIPIFLRKVNPCIKNTNVCRFMTFFTTRLKGKN